MKYEQNPDFLFKYTTFDTAMKTIDNASLYWASVSQFNDPFEYKFRFFTKGNENAVTARFLAATFIKDHNAINIFANNRQLQNLRKKHLNGELDFNSIEVYINNLLLKEKFNINNNKSLTAMSAYRKIFLEIIPVQIKKIIDETTGVLCLTDDSDERSSRLMWSHYADCHKGVRIKLRTKFIESISDSMKSGIRKVRYQENFPLVEYDDYLGFSAGHFPEQTRNLVNKMIFTKSDEWSYENEYRSVIPFGGDSRIINVNPEAFDSIYLGLRVTAKNQDTIITTIKSKMPHVNIFKTEQDDNSYKLIYKKI